MRKSRLDNLSPEERANLKGYTRGMRNGWDEGRIHMVLDGIDSIKAICRTCTHFTPNEVTPYKGTCGITKHEMYDRSFCSEHPKFLTVCVQHDWYDRDYRLTPEQTNG